MDTFFNLLSGRYSVMDAPMDMHAGTNIPKLKTF